MTIATVLNPPTSADDDATYDSKAEQFTLDLVTWTTEANVLASALNTALNLSLLGVTTTSTSSLTIGTGSKTFTVEAGKGFAIGMTLKATDTANTANYMVGTVTSYSGTTLVLNVSSTGGSGTIASWSIAINTTSGATAPSLLRSARAANTILADADKGKLIDCTGTWSQTFTAAATLGSGWWCYVQNSGTGTITLDPNASETINGATTLALLPGDCAIVICDGTAFYASLVTAGVPSITILTSGTSWTCPDGVTRAKIHVIGGGGASGLGNGSVYGISGGGGGTCVAFVKLTPGTSYTYAIGAGGTTGAGGNSTFNDGTTTFTGNGGQTSGDGGTGSGTGAVIMPGQNGQTVGGYVNSSLSGGKAVFNYGQGGYGTISNTTRNAGTAGAIVMELFR